MSATLHRCELAVVESKVKSYNPDMDTLCNVADRLKSHIYIYIMSYYFENTYFYIGP